MTTTDTTRPTRRGFTLIDAGREFWRHPSSWMLTVAFAVAITARLYVGDWRLTDAAVPVVVLTLFPALEWVIHVFILHWKPRRIGALVVDPLLSRKHREHHVNPRDVEAVFIPWQALVWVIPLVFAFGFLVSPRLGMGLTYLVVILALGLWYEWTHYLIHTDYKPKTVVYRAIWRNHRLHHFKNEHYWFTVTSAGTADRVFRTYPDPATVPTSPTAKNLHAGAC